MENTEEKKQDEGMYEKFYHNLNKLRVFNQLTQKEASKNIGLKNPSRYETLESGRGVPTLIEVLNISNYYECTVEELLYKKAVVPILEFK